MPWTPKTVSEGSSGALEWKNVLTLRLIAPSWSVGGMKLDAVCLTLPPGGRVPHWVRWNPPQWLVINFHGWRETVRTVNNHWGVHPRWCVEGLFLPLRWASLPLDSSPNLIVNFGWMGRLTHTNTSQPESEVPQLSRHGWSGTPQSRICLVDQR